MKALIKILVLFFAFIAAKAQSVQLEVLSNFGGTNGAYPADSLTLGNDGNFYGTTYAGGISNLGTIFQVTTNGVLNSLVSFVGTNGANPGGLTPGNDGNFYGTTDAGGISNLGTIFQVTTNGVLSALVSFAGTNGANPYASLTLGSNGNFYGTTFRGGISNLGTIFQVTTDGVLNALVSFVGTNGANPTANLIVGNDGNFYGTTYAGGISNLGTIFMVSTDGILNTLVSFVGTNGDHPQAPLTLGNDGIFYGTTCGIRDSGIDQGTVFKVTANGALTTLYSFTGSSSLGNPTASLIFGEDGNLYGATDEYLGTFFRITTNGLLTTLLTLYGYSSGANPEAGLSAGSDGNLYGTMDYGGANGMGVVYRLGIPPSIATQPTSSTMTNGGSATFNLAMAGTPLNYQWFTSSGRNATAVPHMNGFVVASAVITDGGAGYLSAPQVQFNPNSARGTAVVNNGMVTAINIINSGFYFSAPPIIQIAAPTSFSSQPLLNQTNATLTLSGVTSADTTNYFVIVSNNYGSVTSAMVGLTVFLPPQNFTGLSSGSTTGQQLSLLCTGSANYPYILQSATNLTPPINWQPVITNPADANGNWQFNDTNLNAVQKFYRVLGQ